MKINTGLTSDLINADDQARYDSNAKRLLANKPILAWILKCCIQEFSAMKIADIISCIEGEPLVGKVPTNPGKIIGDMNEDNIPGEGMIRFDIIFRAILPQEKKQIKMYVNIEAQNSANVGYDLVTRGIFYCARMLSRQLETEFHTTDSQSYNQLKKVYSIWIIFNRNPIELQNTIISHKMHQVSLYGDVKDNMRDDLLEVIMIRLGNNGKGNELHHLLNVLFSDLKIHDKIQILENEFDIQTTEQIREDINTMCNLSLGLIENGAIRSICKLVAQGTISFNDGLKEVKEYGIYTESEFMDVASKFGYHITKDMQENVTPIR